MGNLAVRINRRDDDLCGSLCRHLALGDCHWFVAHARDALSQEITSFCSAAVRDCACRGNNAGNAEFEADDVIASIVLEYDFDMSFIMSNDNDLYQCLTIKYIYIITKRKQ